MANIGFQSVFGYFYSINFEKMNLKFNLKFHFLANLKLFLPLWSGSASSTLIRIQQKSQNADPDPHHWIKVATLHVPFSLVLYSKVSLVSSSLLFSSFLFSFSRSERHLSLSFSRSFSLARSRGSRPLSLPHEGLSKDSTRDITGNCTVFPIWVQQKKKNATKKTLSFLD